MNKLISCCLAGAILLGGCAKRIKYSHKYIDEQNEKLSACEKKWQYADLKSDVRLKVLLFDELKRYDLITSPNFLIGLLDNGRYIGIIDKDFKGTIKTGSIITVSPKEWTSFDKEIIKPIYRLYGKKSVLAIYCLPDTLYYGRISKVE